MHFYLKRYEIIKDVTEWLTNAEIKLARYDGMVMGQNSVWCTLFKQSQEGFRK